MNYAYLLAMIGNRLIALACVVILSFLLKPAAFGLYALAATNALLTEIVLGQWIVISANKHLTLGGSEPERTTVSTLAAAILGYCVLMALLAGTCFLFPIAPATPAQVALVLGWSAALVMYDVTLASKNALGQSGSYAILALTKNLGATLLSILFVLMGYGEMGAMAGQIVGTLAPLVLVGSSVRIWRHVRLSQASRSLMLKMLKFGIGGTLALGLYMLFNATSRNLTGWFLGEAEAGYLSLAADLFFGPLALIGSAYALSIVPLLYVVEAEGNVERQRDQVSAFIHMNLFLAVPYALGGGLLAPDIAMAFLPVASREAIASVSAAVAVQSAAMLVLYTIAVTLMIFNRRLPLILAVVGTSALNMLLLGGLFSTGSGLPAAAWGSALVLCAGVAVFMAWGSRRGFMRLNPLTLAKMGAAACVMGGAVWLYNRLLLPGEPFGAALVGLGVYLALTAAMGLSHFRELVPKGRRERLDMASIATPIE